MKLTQGLEGANMRGPRNLLEGIFALLSKDAGQKHAAAAVKTDNIRAARRLSSAQHQSQKVTLLLPSSLRRRGAAFGRLFFVPYFFTQSCEKKHVARPSDQKNVASAADHSHVITEKGKIQESNTKEPTCSCSLNPRTGQDDAPKTSPRHGGAAVHILCSW